MSAQDEEDPRDLAAEYVLGTLDTAERRSVAMRIRNEPDLRDAVSAWQTRLSPLADAVAPVVPTPELWRQIERSIAKKPAAQRPAPYVRSRKGLWHNVGFWRGTAGIASLATAALALFIVYKPAPPVEARFVAVLLDSAAKPSWLVSATPDTNRLNIQPVAAGPDDGRVPELWLIPGPDQAPVSLGLLNRDAEVKTRLEADQLPLLGAGRVLAVSLEPPGGSPTGAPTGPVLYHGLLLEQSP